MTIRNNFVDSDPTVTDHPTHHNDLATAVNSLVTDKLDKTGGALTGALTSTSSLTASQGAADSLAVSGDDITAVGSNTNHQVRVHTKGTGSLRVNGDTGDGTGGFIVYGGGATPVARLTAGSSSGALLLVPSAGLNALRVFKESDAVNRLTVGEDGKVSWGDGTAAVDTNLYRVAANQLATDDTFVVNRASATDQALAFYISPNANYRFYAQVDGKLFWGDGTAALDTNLYRSAADTLKTDDALIVTGALSGSTVTSGLGASLAMQMTTTGFKAVGSNTSQNLYIQSKGTSSVVVNGVSGDGTAGFSVWNGGATPAFLFGVSGAGVVTFGSAGDTNLYRSAADTLATDDDLAIALAGKGLKVKEGSNARMGTATLVAGSVVVSNTSVTATSRIFLTSQVDGGTPGFLRVSTRTAGTSFTITSGSGTDTSTVAYLIVEPA